MIKKGSTLPVDENTKRADALMMAQAGMIDPKTLFEEMSFTNVEQRVADLYAWLAMTGKIQPPQPPQPQMPPGGQGMPQQGQPQGMTQDPKVAQVQKLQAMLQSPQVQNMPPEQKAKVVLQSRKILERIKAGK